MVFLWFSYVPFPEKVAGFPARHLSDGGQATGATLLAHRTGGLTSFL
jgi:hypothetical protein